MNRAISPSQPGQNWQMVCTTAELETAGQKKVRVMGRQIALFLTKAGVRACDNRCPHEGYPLSEGAVSDTCTLTCNWHNWKFDLQTGENLFGGDKLRIYPVEERNGSIWIDIADPPFEAQREQIINNLKYAFDHHSYDQIARECARLTKLGVDPLEPLRLAILWSWERMEFGWTHAYAGMADWIQLYQEHPDNQEIQLTCLLEAVAHTADDVLRERTYPYESATLPFDENGFVNAIETEQQQTAIAMVRGGIEMGLSFDDMERGFSRAALAHYNDFGHSLIYVSKVGELIDALGTTVQEPLLLSLTRSLIFAAREDQIPEFRYYTEVIERWQQGGSEQPSAEKWHRKGIRSALDATLACSKHDPLKIYQGLLEANAISMLSFDINQQYKAHVTVSGNVGWLDFTHGLTFANAVRKQCQRFPALWPAGLLQMACFVGRNAAYTVKNADLKSWASDDADTGFAEIMEKILLHGQGEYIVSVHLLKTAFAVREEHEYWGKPATSALFPALNRFINSPLKRRLPRRVAYQSLKFVEE